MIRYLTRSAAALLLCLTAATGCGDNIPASVVCGDGDLDADEACDDGNTAGDDGCSASCTIEPGFACTGAPSTCTTSCGDGDIAGAEVCDDGNTSADDGCDAACAVEPGFACTGAPSTCTTSCGDGVVAGDEACDDGNTTADDGCDAACAVEPGFDCTGAPSTCTTTCGDGVVAGAEECDDDELDDGDGCDDSCVEEPGWVCSGAPSTCVETCGDGLITGAEACDDDDLDDGDGCDDNCAVEHGFDCAGAPSACTSSCGDGVLASDEACDDDDLDDGDGCDHACAVEHGFDCSGDPSGCVATCGDGERASTEECDDHDLDDGDGCSHACTIEHGFGCAGEPSACASTCGDAVIASDEECDDDETADGDGCSAGCDVEDGWSCLGEPTGCAEVCGDGLVVGGEPCDDDNEVNLDGCSTTCVVDLFDEVEPNNTVATANGPFQPDVRLRGWIAAPSDVDHFAITVPAYADLSLETFDQDGGCAAIDTTITLTAPDGTTVLASDDDSGEGRCSLLDARTAALAHLAPGTYDVAVRSFGGNQLIPSYSLAVRLLARCGDGVRAGTEECDGGPGCTASCQRLPTCGDGFIDAPETCDAPGTPGCSPGCGLVIVPEVEPNGSAAVANGPFTAPTLLGGAVGTVGDVDVVAITIPGTGDLRVETFDATGPGSCAGIDTVLTLFATDGTTVLLERDQGGLGDCSRIDPSRPGDGAARHLPAGTYYVAIRDYLGDGTIPGYTVKVAFDALCGDGVVAGGEECDGGPGCSATCDRVPSCGDGFVDAPETCDSGAGALVGCSPACALQLVTEVEPNGNATAAAANPALGTTALVDGAISPIGDLDIFAITLTAVTDLTIETSDPAAPCAFDTEVTLYGSNGTTVIARNDDAGGSSCAALSAAADPAIRHLAPGTYFLQVREFGDNGAVPHYRLAVAPTAVCGDAVVGGYEECDGGTGCTATCDRVPTCSDGFVDGAETCDDGNDDGGDGCDAACLLETVAEVEPNGATAEADAAAVQLTGTGVVAGAIGAVGDHDLFRLVLATDDVYRVETFSSAGACSIATTVRLLDATGTQLFADGSSGLGRCSALTLHLAAGTYYLQVDEQGNDAAIPAYLLAVSAPFAAGAEVEPNASRGSARAVPGTNVYVVGGHQASVDLDYWAVTVPYGQSIRAEVIEGGAESCESNGIDSYLSLYTANGALLGRDDDGGRGYCSLIDGTGAAPAQGFASGLTGGTYYLSVDASPYSQNQNSDASRFDYRLVIVVR